MADREGIRFSVSQYPGSPGCNQPGIDDHFKLYKVTVTFISKVTVTCYHQ
jgi:hypothetical protein